MRIANLARINLSGLLFVLAIVWAGLAPEGLFAQSDYPEATKYAGRSLRKVELVTMRTGKATIAPSSGKSTVLIPVFTSCPVTCPTILRDFQSALDEAKVDLAKARFDVFVVSFDPMDTVASFKSLVTRQKLPREWNYAVAAPGKDFKEFELLLGDLDFRYRKLPGNAGGFAHPAGAYIFDDKGVVRRFLAQAEFTKEDIVDGIVGSRNSGTPGGSHVGSSSRGKRPGKYSGGISPGSHTQHMDHR